MNDIGINIVITDSNTMYDYRLMRLQTRATEGIVKASPITTQRIGNDLTEVFATVEFTGTPSEFCSEGFSVFMLINVFDSSLASCI